MRFEEDEIAGDSGNLKESANVIHKAKSILGQSTRKENPASIKRELSDHLDSRASNPIHVNNLKSLFGIEKNVNEVSVPVMEEDEEIDQEKIDLEKSGSHHGIEMTNDQIKDKVEPDQQQL